MDYPGVFVAFTKTQLASGNLPNQAITRKALNSFNLSRSGDVFIVLEPFTVASASETMTSHGTPWDYDAHVPLIFWGSAFRHGAFAEPCEPVDLAPTLSQALDINNPSGAVGVPLSKALVGR